MLADTSVVMLPLLVAVFGVTLFELHPALRARPRPVLLNVGYIGHVHVGAETGLVIIMASRSSAQ